MIFNGLFGKKKEQPSYTVHTLTNQGLRRENNEDCTIVDQGHPEAGLLVAVADGMGGHAAGETASRLACCRLAEQYFEKFTELAPDETSEEKLFFLLEKVVYKIHVKLIELAAQNHKLKGMGTTLSALVIRETKGFIIHVGDSRVYLYRQGTLTQITRDHTELQQYIDKGQLTREEAAEHHLRHILSQALGGRDSSFRRSFTKTVNIQRGDMLLLCSDGLYDMTGDAAIKQIMSRNQPLEQMADQLVRKALECGGRDNVTVALVQRDT